MLSVRQTGLSWVRNFGTFLMKGRSEATILAMLTAAIPFLGWLSLVILCLVTLRKGMREGLFVLLWAIIPAMMGSYFIGSAAGSMAFVLETLITYITLWGVSGLLRTSSSWTYVLEVSAAFAISLIVFFHLRVPDLDTFYLNYLLEIYQNSSMDHSNDLLIKEYLQYLVYFLLGTETTLYMIQNLIFLLIARWVQAILYNPKGLSNELKLIRLHWYVWVGVLVFSLLGLRMSPSWALDSFPVFIALLCFAGLSVAHHWISVKYTFKGALLCFYFLFILLIPASFVPLMLLALIDTGWNIQKKI